MLVNISVEYMGSINIEITNGVSAAAAVAVENKSPPLRKLFAM